MRHSLLILIVVVVVYGCSNSTNDKFGPPELRLIVVDEDCPFSQTNVREHAKNAYFKHGIEPEDRASVSLNMFFSCYNLNSSWVVKSRIHLGVELPSGAIAYYESPTFGNMEQIGESGRSVEDFLTITEQTIDKALQFSVDSSDSPLSTRPYLHE